MGILAKGISGAGVLLIAFYAYNPLPPGIEQPLGYSLLLTEMRVFTDISKLADFLGFCDRTTLERYFVDSLYSEPFKKIEKTCDGVYVKEAEFDGVPVRVYDPQSESDDKLRPALFYVHGGGYVIGNIDTARDSLSKIAKDTGRVVVSVSYRLSPEYPAPAAMEDCYRAAKYFFAHAPEWGVDPKTIGVIGDSAGGNMAAALSLRFRDEKGDPQFSYQVLIYPWTQALNFRLPSYLQNEDHMVPLMRQQGMVLFTVSYIGIDQKHIPKFQKNQHVTKATRDQFSQFFDVEALPGYKGEEDEPEVDEDLAIQVEPLITNPYNFPLMAKSLANVPPALVMTMGVDTIRDDGLLYLQRLREEGVDTQHYHDDICWHAAFYFATGKDSFPCGVRLLNGIIEYVKMH